ncbi:hypothetical protein NQ318_013523 [Aromia moschata]|uniref:DDE-1 domain-containing protein n=1 Tax=Aromia moschata TaxID=1265417 RepID=A0AAV8YCV4_9CUCU|nr:hypothetical protein NQ318_013523 [Aromia moschata]
MRFNLHNDLDLQTAPKGVKQIGKITNAERGDLVTAICCCSASDNHESHISLEVYYLAKENGIDMISLPPHTSHQTQPLDISFYGPLKTAYINQCSFWMKSNPGKRISIYEIAEIFGIAYQKVTTRYDKAVN